MARIIAFAGPSLPRPAAAPLDGIADLELRPPARRGDVLGALASRPRVLLLLDGYYFDALAVSHQELLYALDAGVRVIGAASMGALRAAELAPFGMEGVGRVYGWYRDGAIDGDDEVAILHLPGERGYRPATVALVEVRAALERLAASGALAEGRGRRLVARLRRLAFSERSPEAVDAHARACLGEAGAAGLARALAERSVKEEDARLALCRALAPAPAGRPRVRPVTTFLSWHRERYLRGGGEGGGPPWQRLLQAIQVLHPGAPAFVAAWRRRQLLVAAAERAGLPAPAGRVERCAERLGRHLEAALPASLGPTALPEVEVLEEARFHVLAAAARREMGEAGALAALARGFGLPPQDAFSRLAPLVAAGTLALAPWWLARAALFTGALAPALALAAACDEVHRCFERWSAGAAVPVAELHGLAARTWGCALAAVPEEARRRGFPPADWPGEGLEATLRWLAPAELLARPVNAYPDLRERLRKASLRPALGDSRPAPVPRSASARRRLASSRSGVENPSANPA